MTNKYETVFVLSTKTYADDAALEAATEKFKGIIADNGGVITNVDVWGKKRLAYAVNYETEGYYVVVNFDGSADLPKELNRNYHITEGVLRSIVVKK
ncbi:MAG: 30S ribosomal protein S6 [Clostridia bacterium]|nr:30S ribosomal protein S6 [Clostridia bacterium]